VRFAPTGLEVLHAAQHGRRPQARPVGFEFAFGDTGRYGNEAIRYVAAGGIQYFF